MKTLLEYTLGIIFLLAIPFIGHFAMLIAGFVLIFKLGRFISKSIEQLMKEREENKRNRY